MAIKSKLKRNLVPTRCIYRADIVHYQTNKQANRQTEVHTGKHTNRQTGRQAYLLLSVVVVVATTVIVANIYLLLLPRSPSTLSSCRPPSLLVARQASTYRQRTGQSNRPVCGQACRQAGRKNVHTGKQTNRQTDIHRLSLFLLLL